MCWTLGPHLAGHPLDADEYVISADEKTSIQARCRCHLTLAPGQARAMRGEPHLRTRRRPGLPGRLRRPAAKVFGHCEKITGIDPFMNLVTQVMSREPYASAKRVFWVVDNGSAHRELLADFDQQVRRISAQPFRVVARVGGRVRSHVPDLLLVTAAGTGWLVNVKPAAWLADPKIVEALAWPGVLAQRHGWAYEVWSGAEATVLEKRPFP